MNGLLPREILAQVRRIEIMTGRLVSETFAGEYLSVFKGRGMEFAEVREYVPGDDVRTIDWNVTARLGRPFVKRFTEERELTVVIACDVSGSQYFGTAGRLKKEAAVEVAAVLAFSALQNGDRVGLFLFTRGIEKHLPPKKGRRHVLHLIRELLAFAPSGRATDLPGALDTIARVQRRRSILFVISDFRDECNQDDGSALAAALRRAALKHDVVPVLVADPRENHLPRVGAWLELEDPETGERSLIDGSDKAWLSALQRREENRRAALERLFAQTGLDFVRIATDKPTIDPLVAFFRARAKRLRV